MAVILNPYINFVGQAEEALNFYKGVLGGEIEISRFGEFQQMPVEDKYKNQVMHGVLKSDDLQLMISDSSPMGGVKQDGENISLSLSGDSSEDARLTGFYEGLSAGGKITEPLKQAPWGDKFGMFTDKFGIHWMVNIAGPKA